MYSLARQQRGILMNLPLKRCSEDAPILLFNPSRFEFLSNFSFNLSLEYLPSVCLSHCLCLLAYLYLFLPIFLSASACACLLLIVRNPPPPALLSDETYHKGDAEAKSREEEEVQSRRVQNSTSQSKVFE